MHYIALTIPSNLHFFGNGSILDIAGSETRFDSVNTDIILLCNGTRTISEITDSLLVTYNYSDADSSYRNNLSRKIDIFLRKQVELGNVSISDTRKEISIKTSGEQGKYYPKRVVLELTNNCNFHCSHCFRNAGCGELEFLSKRICEELSEKYSGKIFEIQITGGEPLLHPDFAEIVEILKPHFRLILMTNASLLHRVGDDTLKSFSFIQVSLYGIDTESFSKITGTSTKLFHLSLEGIKRINKLDIDNQTVFMVNSTFDSCLKRCVELVISLGGRNLKFGTAAPLGRAVDSGDVQWLYNKEEINRLSDEISDLSDRYSKIIDVYKWETKFDTSNPLLFHPEMPQCGAGFTHICITNTGQLKSCQFLPDTFLLSRETSLDMIVDGIHDNQRELLLKYAKKLADASYNVDDVCTLLSAVHKELENNNDRHHDYSV